ncbi:MAG TPA: hypothetical protein VGG39_17155 [Polyangiaceae bacterium]
MVRRRFTGVAGAGCCSFHDADVVESHIVESKVVIASVAPFVVARIGVCDSNVRGAYIIQAEIFRTEVRAQLGQSEDVLASVTRVLCSPVAGLGIAALIAVSGITAVTTITAVTRIAATAHSSAVTGLARIAALGAVVGGDSGVALAIVGFNAILVVVIAAFVIRARKIVAPRKIDDTNSWLTGVHPMVLAAVSSSEGVPYDG